MSNDNALEVLQEMKGLLSDPQHWTKGQSARDADGDGIDALDERAVCWCLIGAGDRVMGLHSDTQALSKLYDVLREDYGLYSIANYNDAKQRTHADILQLLDKAIERATPEFPTYTDAQGNEHEKEY